MTNGSNFAIVAGAGTPHPRNLPARVTKSRSASNLHDGSAHSDGGENRSDAQFRKRPLSHSETFEHAPLWYGPRLRPAFVAQVLGQVLYPEARDPHSAFAAYEDGAAQNLLRAALDQSA